MTALESRDGAAFPSEPDLWAAILRLEGKTSGADAPSDREIADMLRAVSASRAALRTPATTVAVPWDGFPPDRDRDGWHWLSTGADSEPYPLRWTEKGWWMGLADGSVSTVKAQWTYIGPVPPAQASTPANTGEGLAAWIKRLDRARMLIETAWMDDEPIPCEVTARNIVQDIVGDMRALAALPPSSGWEGEVERLRLKVDCEFAEVRSAHDAIDSPAARIVSDALGSMQKSLLDMIAALPLPPPPSSGDK